MESQAADFYALDKTPIEVEIEHEGQIVKAAMTNKSLYTNVAVSYTHLVYAGPAAHRGVGGGRPQLYQAGGLHPQGRPLGISQPGDLLAPPDDLRLQQEKYYRLLRRAWERHGLVPGGPDLGLSLIHI